MKTEISRMVTITAAALLVSGCGTEIVERPRLLAGHEARVSDVSGANAQAFASFYSDVPVPQEALKITRCTATPDHNGRPRLVLGEPPCLVFLLSDRSRID
ncbi:MAG TPA: hypothetical protein VIL28_01930 [Steroidobacteraceae bacterium]